MNNKNYIVKVTNGRLTIPVEIRREFGFLGKKIKINVEIKNGALVLDFKKIKP